MAPRPHAEAVMALDVPQLRSDPPGVAHVPLGSLPEAMGYHLIQVRPV